MATTIAVPDRKYVALGDRIAKLRELAGLSQRALATRIGVSDGYVPKVESGIMRPLPPKLRKIARALSVTYDELAVLAGYQDETGEITPEARQFTRWPRHEQQRWIQLRETFRQWYAGQVAGMGELEDESSAAPGRDDEPQQPAIGDDT